MNLKEFEGKAYFKKYNVPVPRSRLIKDLKDLQGVDFDGVVLKAQVLTGKRGKAGLVQVTTKANAESVARDLLGKKVDDGKVRELLAEERVEVEKEMYLSLTINRSEKNITCVFTREGGVDVEELSRDSPEKVLKFNLTTFNYRYAKKFFSNYGFFSDELVKLVGKLHKLMKDLDAELVEVNPLAISDGKLIALDSKIVIDDNALFRHPEFRKREERELTRTEKLAHEYGLAYVELDGDIAVIGNGAGLVMATLDMLDYYKGRPSNFLDVGGGASVEKMERALEVVLSKTPTPKAVLINIFGGITRCDEIATGLANYKERVGIKQPLVVRMIGTNESAGKKVLEDNEIHSTDSMQDAAKKVVELTK